MLGRILGHSNPETKARYAHTAKAPADAIADATGKHIALIWNGDTQIPRARAQFIVRQTVAQRVALAHLRRKPLLLEASITQSNTVAANA